MKIIKEKFSPNPLYKEAILKARVNVVPSDKNLTKWYSNYSLKHVNRLAFDLEYLVDNFPNKTGTNVLEIGSVPPVLTLAIKDAGYQVTGLDIEPNRFEKTLIEHDLNIVKGTIGNALLPFNDESYDVIIMNEVFEHLNGNLIDIFRDIKRILRPKGKIFISTPNLKSLIGIRNFLFKDKAYSCCGEIYDEYDKIKKYGHMGHVREYTPTEVTLFLKQLGFEIDSLIYRGKHPKKYRLLDKIYPQGRPFFSIVAKIN